MHTFKHVHIYLHEYSHFKKDSLELARSKSSKGRLHRNVSCINSDNKMLDLQQQKNYAAGSRAAAAGGFGSKGKKVSKSHALWNTVPTTVRDFQTQSQEMDFARTTSFDRAAPAESGSIISIFLRRTSAVKVTLSCN